MHTLENEYLKVTIADNGAELCSVYDKENEFERIWNADPSVWNRHAPILFPFVGKVVDGVYRIDDKQYEMKTQHGFARDMEFELVEKTDSLITQKLVANEQSKKIYPYDFELYVTHMLDSENPRLLHVKWEIKNNSLDTMYYSIGGHPAFTLPIEESKEKEDFFIGFEGSEELTYITINTETGLAIPKEQYTFKTEDGLVKFFDVIYKTLIFEHEDIQKVSIAKPDKTPYVTMDCREFPYLGVWTKTTGNFICLEPWVGRTDDEGFTGTLKEKTGEQKLNVGETFSIAYSMEFHK